ncbi:MAG: N-acetyltransferase [Ruminococcaceae bacterium]|nr:N-acetyltransferase [Oscillospiraceae bacterium]
MQIRKAKASELTEILAIYERARGFMRETGNPTQWEGGYPSYALLSADIEAESLYLIEDEEGIHGVFAFFPEGDPVYDALSVSWLNPLSYGAIHRVASAGTKKGMLGACVDFCLSVRENLKIDTHKDNLVMQAALKKAGFTECGTANIPDVGERILFQRCERNQL